MPPIWLGILQNPVTAIGLPIALGFGSGLITQTSVRAWYPTLAKPPITPPNKAFPVVWAGLYAGMGISSWLLAKSYDSALTLGTRNTAAKAIHWYWVQLALNLAWTPLFFGAQFKKLALVDIVACTGSLIKLTSLAFELDQRVGWFFVAYTAWTSYATYLNGGIAWLNR